MHAPKIFGGFDLGRALKGSGFLPSAENVLSTLIGGFGEGWQIISWLLLRQSVSSELEICVNRLSGVAGGIIPWGHPVVQISRVLIEVLLLYYSGNEFYCTLLLTFCFNWKPPAKFCNEIDLLPRVLMTHQVQYIVMGEHIMLAKHKQLKPCEDMMLMHKVMKWGSWHSSSCVLLLNTFKLK